MKRAAFTYFAVLASLLVVACSGGGGSPKTNPTPTPTPTSTSTGSFNQAAFTCPTSDTSAAVARAPGRALGEVARRAAPRPGPVTPATDLLAVTYGSGFASGARTQLAAREQHSGAAFVREFSFSHLGTVTRIVRVASGSSLEQVAAQLRTQPGVRDVARTGFRRWAQSVSGPDITNDPYFQGFGPGAPLYETASSPGQWDKHAVRLEFAFEYSQLGNGSNVHNANALGSPNVKIAIIDSGEDPTHPELSSKITYQRCFLTDPNGNTSSSNFETDPTGHGTDVAGIAAAATNNSLGFVGSGGNAVIYGYRVFPTPDDNCLDPTTTDSQCSSDTGDIAAAIEDAVAQHVNVINLSLGGGVTDTCSNGVDPDPTEGAAIGDAIAANIVVVAAAGNGDANGHGQPNVTAPGCDTGVIAAGATGLADGQPNGNGNSDGSATSPTEYLASYSNYGSPGNAVNSGNAWGIVAPGGDPSAAESTCTSTGCIDDLHWIENIWTSAPFDSNFSGDCSVDLNAVGTTTDCRTLIAGTSMSTPAIAGAAALILSVNASYQSPAAMKRLLCQTADDIADSHQGCGRLDLYRAMAVALGDSSPPSARPQP